MLINAKSILYKEMVEKLYHKCQRIQAENERCVMRVNGIKKIIRRRDYDVKLLKKRLDKHGDNWRSVPMEAPHPKGKTEQKRRGPKPKNKQPIDGEATAPGSTIPAAKKPRKQRVKQPTSPSSIVQPIQPQTTLT
ncbi:TCF3 fusion partner homolog [Drosophila bipectinata]|uniref:TCF3 fusion partner homolog n=1 Tax=Drosophila bipectinata TaxID=42026 RepID=UPI0007E7C1EE|nr:TCF3 fusion partner homolog [Drosophila bipectinata]